MFILIVYGSLSGSFVLAQRTKQLPRLFNQNGSDSNISFWIRSFGLIFTRPPMARRRCSLPPSDNTSAISPSSCFLPHQNYQINPSNSKLLPRSRPFWLLKSQIDHMFVFSQRPVRTIGTGHTASLIHRPPAPPLCPISGCRYLLGPPTESQVSRIPFLIGQG